MDLVTVGTGTVAPSARRTCACHWVARGEIRVLLDCGAGLGRQREWHTDRAGRRKLVRLAQQRVDVREELRHVDLGRHMSRVCAAHLLGADLGR